jgi:branched-chain amino acid transport system ATP-binding protein
MCLLDISGLSASYGEGRVLEDIALSLDAGAVLGVVGPNGHGKTSLLRTISGLMPKAQGKISFEGRDILGQSAESIARSGIVHVPQGDLIYKNMTIKENLQMGGYSNHSTAETAAQLDQVYALFPKLKQRNTQIASSLSGGERRMLGIGRGLMMKRARLLMLDEPSLGLAPIVIDQIYQAIEKLVADGLTIIVVEENIHRVSAVSKQMILLSHGNVVWTGAPADLEGDARLAATYLGI